MTTKLMFLAIAIVASLIVMRGLGAGTNGKPASTLHNNPEGARLEIATFGGGCFWHVEDDFRRVEGVVSTEVGYEGGTKPEPTYEDVCTNLTGHAEVVQIHYDPSKVSYEKLLEAFFGLHDPTTLNRQGLDFGKQYRSVIFYHTPEQKAKAEKYKAELEKNHRYNRPIVTEIAPESTFWKAEEYHQQYYEKQRS